MPCWPAGCCQKHPESVQSSQEEENPHPSDMSTSIQVPPLQSSVHIQCPVISSQLQNDDAQLFSQSSIHSYPSGQPFWKQPEGLAPGQEGVSPQSVISSPLTL